jgi:fatty-acyl-CoA synthase
VGEAVAAVVTVADHAEITLDGLRDYAARRLARYKLPRRLKVVRAVPRNAAGKLDKAVIRRLVAEGEQT